MNNNNHYTNIYFCKIVMIDKCIVTVKNSTELDD